MENNENIAFLRCEVRIVWEKKTLKKLQFLYFIVLRCLPHHPCMGWSQSVDALPRVDLERGRDSPRHVSSYKLGIAVAVILVAFCPTMAAASASLDPQKPSASAVHPAKDSVGALMWALILTAAAFAAIFTMMFFDGPDDDYDDDDDEHGLFDEFDNDDLIDDTEQGHSVAIPLDDGGSLESLRRFLDHHESGSDSYALSCYLEDAFADNPRDLFYFGLCCVRAGRLSAAETAVEALEIVIDSKKWRKDAFQMNSQALALLKRAAFNTHLPDWTGRWQQVQAALDPFSNSSIAAVLQQRDDGPTAGKQPSSALNERATTGTITSKWQPHRTVEPPSASDAGTLTVSESQTNLCSVHAGALSDELDASFSTGIPHQPQASELQATTGTITSKWQPHRTVEPPSASDAGTLTVSKSQTNLCSVHAGASSEVAHLMLPTPSAPRPHTAKDDTVHQ